MQTSRWPISRLPISNITPFTYRDGETYVSLLNRLAEYITGQLHPNLRETVEHIIEEMEHILAKQHGKYVEGVQDFQRIHDAFMTDVNSALMALNDEAVTELIDDPGTSLGSTVRDVIMESRDSRNFDAPGFNLFFPESHGSLNDTQSIQAAIDAAQQYGGTVQLQPRTYQLDDTLRVTSGITIQGVPDKTILDTANVPSGQYAIHALGDSRFTRFRLSGINIEGTPARNSHGILAGGDGRLGITDFEVDHVRIEHVNIGLKASYTWCGNFRLLRIHNTIKPLELGSQINALHFDTCSISSFTGTMSFTNCETVLFTNLNLVNSLGDGDAMAVNQSNLTFVNPYFEFIKGLASLGHLNDSLSPSFTTIGGRVCGIIQLNMPDVVVNIQSPWYVTMDRGEFPDDRLIIHARRRSESGGAPTRFYQVDEDRASSIGERVVYEWNAGDDWDMLNATGGSPTITHHDTFTRYEGPNSQGPRIPVALEPDTQYVIAIRFRAVGDNPRALVRFGDAPSMALPVGEATREFQTQYIPIHSSGGGDFRFLVGSSEGLDIQHVKVTQGL